MSEFMMTGLRLTQQGVREEEFQNRFGRSLHEVYGKEIAQLLKVGLIEWIKISPLPLTLRATQTKREEGVGLRLTKRGRLLGNQVFMKFI
jgi:oxygen-independent coproporphyrinogen-3 oxidase